MDEAACASVLRAHGCIANAGIAMLKSTHLGQFVISQEHAVSVSGRKPKTPRASGKEFL